MTRVGQRTPANSGDWHAPWAEMRSVGADFGVFCRDGREGTCRQLESLYLVRVHTTGDLDYVAKVTNTMLWRLFMWAVVLGMAPKDTLLGQSHVWYQADKPAAVATGIAYDGSTASLVVFGGLSAGHVSGTTWIHRRGEWFGSNASGPSPRFGHSLTSEAAPGSILLVGGYDNNSYRADGWSWNGDRWTSFSTGTMPGRAHHATAYDPLRRRIVLFGGVSGAGLLGDTWEWDGIDWSTVAATGPSPRQMHSMTFDAARGRVLLFGGFDAAGFRGDTWEWDGVAWTQVASSGPQPRRSAALAYDALRGKAVLFGGVASSGPVADTWEWNSQAWMPMFAATSPPAGAALATFDESEGRVVVSAGSRVWYWTGPPQAPAWTTTPAVVVGKPAQRARHALVYDPIRQNTVMFGGMSVSLLSDTWIRDGGAWAQRSVPGPGARYGHRMTFDSWRNRVVLFGGSDLAGTEFGDTWEWDGTAWTQVATSGPARNTFGMTFDSLRGRIVLFGGGRNGVLQGDTWEWDGTAWGQVATSGPSARHELAMAFDPTTQASVLIGGLAATGYLRDVWSWNGTVWTRGADFPSPLSGHACVYDPVLRKLVVIGGRYMNTIHSDTWTWNGSSATSLSGQSPGGRLHHSATFDSRAGATVMFAGYSGVFGPFTDDTWTLRGPTSAAYTFGQGCGTPELRLASVATALPVTGRTARVRVDHIATPLVYVAVGTSSVSMIGNLPLPLSLTPYGAPGCFLNTSADLGLHFTAVVNSASTASWDLALPNSAAFWGLNLYLQAWNPAPGANPQGLLTSNGLALRVGSY